MSARPATLPRTAGPDVVAAGESTAGSPIRTEAPPRGALGSDQMPTEAEIREVVRRVVTGMGETEGAAPSPQRSEPTTAATATIAVGADHGGYPLKEKIGFRLKEQGYDVVDCGTDSAASVDYPDFARAVAELVSTGQATYGIVVDGAGIGSSIAANKVPGVRAALCYDISSARNSREHNHANVLTLGAGLIGPALALQIVETWLNTPWAPGRHAARVDKISAIERHYLRSGA